MYNSTLSLTSVLDVGWAVNSSLQPLYPHETEAVPTVQEVGWATGPVWTGAGKLELAGIRSPDRPAYSESIKRLRHPGPHAVFNFA